MESDDEMLDTSNDAELNLMSQEWDRMCQSRHKDGFIAGSTQGKERTLQEGFNIGFKKGYFSNFILSKIKGILAALMAYQASYEGNPISDSILLEAQSLMEEISFLEMNFVAEDFLKMNLHQARTSQSDEQTNELMQTFTKSTTLEDECTSSVSTCRSDSCGNSRTECCKGNENRIKNERSYDSDTEAAGHEALCRLDEEVINSLLLQCPQIINAVNKCKTILKSLKWTDDMIDRLLC